MDITDIRFEDENGRFEDGIYHFREMRVIGGDEVQRIDFRQAVLPADFLTEENIRRLVADFLDPESEHVPYEGHLALPANPN